MTPSEKLTKPTAAIRQFQISSPAIREAVAGIQQAKSRNEFFRAPGYSKTGKLFLNNSRGIHQAKNSGLATIGLSCEVQAQLESYVGESFFGNLVAIKSQDLLLWYPAGPGLGLHSDDYSPTDHHRMLTAIVYLNAGYVGGEIEFPAQNFSLKPSAGDAILFPGNRLFSHRILPIQSGERYAIMQTWALRPRLASLLTTAQGNY